MRKLALHLGGQMCKPRQDLDHQRRCKIGGMFLHREIPVFPEKRHPHSDDGQRPPRMIHFQARRQLGAGSRFAYHENITARERVIECVCQFPRCFGVHRAQRLSLLNRAPDLDVQFNACGFVVRSTGELCKF